MVYLNGEAVYKLANAWLIDHIVELCEKKAAEIEARARESELEPAQ